MTFELRVELLEELLEELGGELPRPVPTAKVGRHWVCLGNQKEANVVRSLFCSTVLGPEEYEKEETVEIGKRHTKYSADNSTFRIYVLNRADSYNALCICEI